MAARHPVLGTRLTYSHHLVELVAAAEAAAVRLAAADPDRRAAVVGAARRESALLSARLDGSPLTDATATQVDEHGAAGSTQPSPRRETAGSWARALKLDSMQTQEVAAIEYANLLRCFDEEPGLAERLFAEPLETMRRAHGLICERLMDPAALGRPRLSDQAVHDGAQGQVIYNAPGPQRLPALLDGLAQWLGRGSAVLPTVVLAGVLHERILEWQPFEAGNGRLARVTARLVLRARGLDPHGAAVPERSFAAEPLAYYREVSATIRRRGALEPWLERYAEAVVAGLDAAVAAIAPGPARIPSAEGTQSLAALPQEGAVTLADFAAATGTNLELARRRVRDLVAAGTLVPEAGMHGLRFRRRRESDGACPAGQGYRRQPREV